MKTITLISRSSRLDGNSLAQLKPKESKTIMQAYSSYSIAQFKREAFALVSNEKKRKGIKGTLRSVDWHVRVHAGGASLVASAWANGGTTLIESSMAL